MLEPYAPLNLDAIMSAVPRQEEPAGLVRHGRLGRHGVLQHGRSGQEEHPQARDLEGPAKPAYKGQIVMPNPASSGTGFFDVTAWLTLWGDDNGKGGGWKYMDGLHENIAQYTHSRLQALQHGRRGEFVVGISFEYRANANKAKGAPIDLVFPKEGLGWDLEAFAIHKGTKKLDAAKKLADWASSKDAMLLYGKNFAITAQPGVAAPLANVPKDYEARLVKMDFAWAAENRERILAEWTKRYNAKSSPPSAKKPTAQAARRAVPRMTGACPRAVGHPQAFGSFTALRTSTSRSRRASSSASWARRAAARRRCCASSPGWTGRPRPHRAGRARHLAPAAGAARLRHRLPVLRAVPQPDAWPTTWPTGWSTASRPRAERARG
jgi:iron(III) transport system substrate-binding protein